MTTLINLYGGPGIGKSTIAAEIYSALKNKGVNAELVREYVKSWAWEGREVKPLDQLYLWGKQVHAETTVVGKADVVVTDSPAMLAAVYLERRGDKYRELAKHLYAASVEYHDRLRRDGHHIVDVLLMRVGPYQAGGRFQTRKQAEAIDRVIQARLDFYASDYDRCIGAADVIELAGV